MKLWCCACVCMCEWFILHAPLNLYTYYTTPKNFITRTSYQYVCYSIRICYWMNLWKRLNHGQYQNGKFRYALASAFVANKHILTQIVRIYMKPSVGCCLLLLLFAAYVFNYWLLLRDRKMFRLFLWVTRKSPWWLRWLFLFHFDGIWFFSRTSAFDLFILPLNETAWYPNSDQFCYRFLFSHSISHFDNRIPVD